MTIRPIDWDDYEVLEKEDYELSDLEKTIEELREDIELQSVDTGTISIIMEELMEDLGALQDEEYDIES